MGHETRWRPLLVAVAIAAGCQWRSDGTPVDRVPSSGVTAVKTVRPRRVVLLRKTTQPATVHAFHTAELYSKVAGYLSELRVDIGDSVKANAVLAKVAVPEMVKDGERQEAVIEQLEAEAEVVKAKVEQSRAEVKQAKSDSKRADAQLAADGFEFGRVEKLFADKAVTEQLRDEARNRFEAAKAAKDAAEAKIDSTEAGLKVAQAEVKTAGARIRVAKKQDEEIDARIAYATIVAPFDGIVTERNIDPGDLVRDAATSTAGDRPPLLTIAQLDKVRVRVAIPEREASWLGPEDPAEFRTVALPGQALTGTVTRIARSLDESTRTMLAEIDLPNPEGKLMPGMFGQVTITLEERPKALVLPAAAVRSDAKGETYVYVVDHNRKILSVAVSTGLDDGTRIEITDGLTGNEEIVTGTIGRLQPGQLVRVIEE